MGHGLLRVTDYERQKRDEILMRSLVKPHTSPSPSSPPLKGGEILQPSPLEGEGEGEGALLMNSLVEWLTRETKETRKTK
jgi:hypothetical protein